MFSPILLLAYFAAHSALTIAGPLPATDSGAQNPANLTTAKPLYIVTSAYVHQYFIEQPAETTTGVRQATDGGGSPVTNSTASNSTGSTQPTANPPDLSNVTSMEDFNITIIPAASNGTAAVHCNTTWNSERADIGGRDRITNTTFSCDDHQTSVRMERRQMMPGIGFYVFVKMPGIPEATWMVQYLWSPKNKKAGWTLQDGDYSFKGAAQLTHGDPPALADFLDPRL